MRRLNYTEDLYKSCSTNLVTCCSEASCTFKRCTLTGVHLEIPSSYWNLVFWRPPTIR